MIAGQLHSERLQWFGVLRGLWLIGGCDAWASRLARMCCFGGNKAEHKYCDLGFFKFSSSRRDIRCSSCTIDTICKVVVTLSTIEKKWLIREQHKSVTPTPSVK
jgi:hypothetical protein